MNNTPICVLSAGCVTTTQLLQLLQLNIGDDFHDQESQIDVSS
jgi:hypothetical protein